MGDFLQPWHILLLLMIAGSFLIPGIFYLLALQNLLNKCAPASRTIEPSLVWLSLIPFFNLVWNFFVVIGIARSLRNEFVRRGIPSRELQPGKSIGLAMCICACCGLIPILGVIASLASFVLWIVYWVKVAQFSRTLDMSQPTVTPIPLA